MTEVSPAAARQLGVIYALEAARALAADPVTAGLAQPSARVLSFDGIPLCAFSRCFQHGQHRRCHQSNGTLADGYRLAVDVASWTDEEVRLTAATVPIDSPYG